jgi:two-component system, cell cycle response regulator DivK
MPRILIVEDNEDNRDMLGRRLQRRGFEVTFAVDGEEGVTKATSDAPDLILLDMSLPKLDGWSVAQQLRRQEIATPIVALTAHAMQGDREKALAAGCDDYDTKPVELPRLLEKIDTLLKCAA